LESENLGILGNRRKQFWKFLGLSEFMEFLELSEFAEFRSSKILAIPGFP
jgi:hypothetical protein